MDIVAHAISVYPIWEPFSTMTEDYIYSCIIIHPMSGSFSLRILRLPIMGTSCWLTGCGGRIPGIAGATRATRVPSVARTGRGSRVIRISVIRRSRVIFSRLGALRLLNDLLYLGTVCLRDSIIVIGPDNLSLIGKVLGGLLVHDLNLFVNLDIFDSAVLLCPLFLGVNFIFGIIGVISRFLFVNSVFIRTIF